MHCKIFTWGELSLPEEILPEENTQLAEIIMVHPGGFEPPTARFVAEYSIQLSYGCIRNGGEGGIRTLDAAFDRILP